jgi:hypothetical protein
MKKTLFDRAIERDSPNPDSYIKTAFDEILGVIYSSATSETVEDKIIEDMAYYAMKKLEIEESNFNWQTIEDILHKETYSLATWHFNFSEVIQIVSKGKVSDNYDWEDIKSNVMSVEEINTKILSDFKINLDEHISIYSIDETKKSYINVV